jgi:hypothetical protein
MARKVIEERINMARATLPRIAALILVVGIAFYFEQKAKRESIHPAW